MTKNPSQPLATDTTTTGTVAASSPAAPDRSDETAPARLTSLLAIYLILGALLCGFFVYVLWPDTTIGSGGRVEWATGVRVFGSTASPVVLGSEPRLLLLVLLVGALGSFLHAATSFVTFVGNRSLRTSWAWWYVLRPFMGMALALIFYFVLRGGLLSTGSEASEVSPFGMAAVAGLVGMFSKQATDKLKEVFDNLFRTQAGSGDDERRDKVTGRVAVKEKMIPRSKIAGQEIPAGGSAANVPILDVYQKYGGVVTRLPVFDDRGRVQCVIHQSLIYKFISAQSVESTKSGSAVDLGAKSLEDFLALPEFHEAVRAIAFVAEDDTVDDASRAMAKISKCQDVFVTEHGRPDEEVLGWLTNVDIGRLASG